MLIIILYVFLIFTAYILSKFESNKYASFVYKLFNYLIIVFLIVIMAGNTNNPDTQIYLNIYKSTEFFSKDFGFGYLILLFNKMNLSFYALRFVISAIGIILIDFTLKKLKADKRIFYILYVLYPFFFDLVQMRNFLAMSIVFFAFYILTNSNKYNRLKYVILVLLAASFQKTALAYLPFAFLDKTDKYFNIIYAVIILVSLYLAFNRGTLLTFSNFLDQNFSENLNGLHSKLLEQTRFGWIVTWAYQFINYFSIKYIYDKKKDILTKSEYQCAKIAHYINKYMFIFLPLYILTPTFSRIMRNVIPINIVIYSYYFKKSKLKFNYFKILIYVYFIFMFSNTFLNSDYLKTIIIPAFEDNYIIDYIKP